MSLLEQLLGLRCPLCNKALTRPILCNDCEQTLVPKHSPSFVYLGDYRLTRGASRDIKYHGNRNLAGLLGQKIALGVRQAGWHLDGITAVPTPIHRKLLRGYNQAELLAQAVAKALGVPYKTVISRSHSTSQTQKSLLKRQQLPENTFKPQSRINGAWLLVDDVITTGTTFAHAKYALFTAGAAKVYGAVIGVKSPRSLK
jgi:ComF family protein